MATTQGYDQDLADDGPTLGELVGPFREAWLQMILFVMLGAAVGAGSSFLQKPTYVATTVFLPPQQQQSAAASALAALGPLSALAGVGGSSRAPGDQYAALMRSVTVSDRVIDQFGLIKEYEADFRVDARRKLEKFVRIGVNKKDGLISVDVEDTSPQRAAQIANQYVEELRRITAGLAITDAQQRRTFFERQLQETRDSLKQAQAALEISGFNSGALKAEPKAAAESYARLKAEVAAAEVRLQAVRGQFADRTPEVQQLASTLAALRSQLAKAEQPANSNAGPDYIGKYRDFKYQEALFEVYARQFELARVDESREGALIQVVDVAQPPEKKAKPMRTVWLALGAAAGLLLGALLAVWRWRRAGKHLRP